MSEASRKASLWDIIEKHDDHSISSMYLRVLAEAFQFQGSSYGAHSHYVAVPFLDHMLSFTSNSFTVKDRAMPKRIVRSTVLLSYTSMAKSPLLKDHVADAQSELVQQTISASPSPALKARADFDHVHAEGRMNFTQSW